MTTTARSILSLIAGTGIGLSACGGEPPAALASVIDSAGVQIVTSAGPHWDADEAWAIEEHPSLEIPSDFGDPDHFLFFARHVQRMDDGGLLVGNGGSHQLLAFDSLGTFLGPVGRPGQGPGETERVFGLFSCAADTIVVHEGARISLWDPDFEFVRTERTAGRLMDGRSDIVAVSDDCSAGLFPNFVYEPPPQDKEPSDYLCPYTGQPSTDSPEIRSLSSSEWSSIPGPSTDNRPARDSPSERRRCGRRSTIRPTSASKATSRFGPMVDADDYSESPGGKLRPSQ